MISLDGKTERAPPPLFVAISANFSGDAWRQACGRGRVNIKAVSAKVEEK